MDNIMELIQLAQNGDDEAKERIIKENSGLIWSIVRKFMGRGYEMEDLYQIGSIGLLKCIEKFDTTYNVKFSTYAVPMIIGEIKRFLRDDGMIKISRPLKETAMKARYVQESLRSKNGMEPTISELAREMEITPEELVMAMEAGREVESIYSTVYQGDGSPVYLIDKLSRQEDDNDTIVDMITLKEILGKLPQKERQIITMRYFDDKTQAEIAKVVGISQVQVSRIEKKVLSVIREKFG